ncbi:MAG: DNA polymerase III subunit delta [Candidatus Krumholzibacteria bacterium]|nr:DNA polymerase III subunit delta [Candidatus Krumholzibacteria bacterium]
MRADLAYYRRVFDSISSDEPLPLYLLKGDEAFIMEELTARIVDRHVPEDMRSFNLSIDYGGEVDVGQFLATAGAYPFLGERRVLVLKELERLKGGWKPLVEYCASPGSSSVIVFLLGTHDERRRKLRLPRDAGALEKAVAAKGRVIPCERLGDAEVRKWIVSAAKRAGVTMTGEAASAMHASVGADLFDLQNEMAKIAVVFEGETVTGADLAGIIGAYRLNAVYDLIDCVGTGDEGRSVRVLSKIIQTGAERPSVVLYHLIRHFLGLLKAKAGQSDGGFRPEGRGGQSGAMSTRTILIWLENLRTAELAIKSTSLPERLLIEGAVLHSFRGMLLDPSARTVGAA